MHSQVDSPFPSIEYFMQSERKKEREKKEKQREKEKQSEKEKTVGEIRMKKETSEKYWKKDARDGRSFGSSLLTCIQ